MVISKKKSLHLESILYLPLFCPDFIMISQKYLQQNETVCAIFEGAPKRREARGNCLIRLTQYPPLTRAEGLFFYHLRMLHYPNQMLTATVLSENQVLSLNRETSCSMWWPMFRMRRYNEVSGLFSGATLAIRLKRKTRFVQLMLVFD